METPTITVTEDTLSVSVCAVLINLVQLEIPLTAFVETQPVTATGNFVQKFCSAVFIHFLGLYNYLNIPVVTMILLAIH